MSEGRVAVVTGAATGIGADFLTAMAFWWKYPSSSDDLIALASEEVAIRAILPQEIDTYDPYDEETRVWQA